MSRLLIRCPRRAETKNCGAIQRQLTTHRKSVLCAVAKARLPAVYPSDAWDSEGAMVAYYADLLAQYQLAGAYAGRLLNGAAVADLPVHSPDKYILSLNLKVAALVGITIPPGIIARSDKVAP